MFNLREMFNQSVAAGSAAFVAVFPAGLVGDLRAAKAAVVAGLAAAFGVAAGFVGNLVKQLIAEAKNRLAG